MTETEIVLSAPRPEPGGPVAAGWGVVVGAVTGAEVMVSVRRCEPGGAVAAGWGVVMAP